MKKRIFKKLAILVFIILVLAFTYNLFKAFTSNKQTLEVITARQLSTNDSVEATVSVKDKKTDNSIKSKVTIELRDKNNKKIKNFKETCKIEEGERANFSVPLPENIESGSYILKVTSQSGLKSDTEKINISINDQNSTNAVISLDKGIYKPGDEVNFRALLISKKDDTPTLEDVEISIYDANNNRVYLNNTQTSEFGIVSGKFTLANEVNSGEYKISVSTKSSKVTKSFTVNPYVLPTFEVNVDNVKDTYAIDEITDISINAKYFFGEPVANVAVKGTLNGEEFTGLTNKDGVYVLKTKLSEFGKYDLDVKVIDTSNYQIEASKTFYASDEPFTIEIIPENADIIKGIENKIYFITKKVDGTPVKTHIEVTMGNLNKQVITDESGIGMLSINPNEIDRLTSLESIKAVATDMENNSNFTERPTDIMQYTGTVVGLDKLIYKQNEDINITLNSTTTVNNKTVIICKNNKVLKVISTDTDQIKVNLEDAYGLIDIYTENNLSNYALMPKYGRITDSVAYIPTTNISSNYYKKTIFISPEKGLNIDIATDKEEYKPGEKLNLSINTSNEQNTPIDSNLLVSILDEAVLELADNDLSIDNIKLALEDVELSDGITLADLYAEILEGSSDSRLRVVLLRQGIDNPNVIKTISPSYSSTHEDYIIRAIILGISVAVIAFSYCSYRFKKARVVAVALLNIFVTFLVVYTFLQEILYYELDLSSITTVVTSIIVSIMLYALVLYKINNWIFNAIINLVAIPGILAIGIFVAIEVFSSEVIAISIALIPAIIMTILVVLSRKFKLNNFWTNIKKLVTQCTISEVVYLISGIISSMLDFYEIGALIVLLIVYWLSQKIYVRKEDASKSLEMSANANIIIATIAIFFVIYMIYIYNATTNSFGGDIVIRDDFADTAINTMDSVSTSKGNSASFDFDGFLDKSSDVMESTEEIVTETIQDETSEKTKENVRNVFLESLAFIPELVTENGKAGATIDISDNITTWNIQAVGNTKDGRIGYNSSTFKVFKEFFIDFSVPTNSVVTDKTNIPVTVYNYQDTDTTVSLNVKTNEWSKIGDYEKSVQVPAKSTKMVYVPLELLSAGNQTLRIEAEANGVSDIVEKTLKVSPNGLKKEKVVSSGLADRKLDIDHFVTETAIENTRNLKVKLYPSVIAQTVEGMENIFRMPTGCFEQTSSSLYPNILALKYLEDNGLDEPEIKEKALDYISKGYQRILTFETSTNGGYSLYGDDPAENVLTAFGLMELNDLKAVYDIVENVTEDMQEYLFDEQNINGTFDIGSTYIGSASNTDDLAINAYIIWALSEVCPEDTRLKTSVDYLENKLSEVRDNYTLALMANVFSNTKSGSTKNAINKLLESVEEDSDGGAYVSSSVRDYWGSYGRYQDVQTTALTSIVLTKEKTLASTNNALLKYIIKNKDSMGTWSTTQATILALKAINSANSNENISNQTITVSVNGSSKEVEIKDNPLDFYELTFDNIKDENKISLDFKKGNIYYEFVEEYYVPYEKLDNKANTSINVMQTIDTTVKVNDNIKQNITITNLTGEEIRNGLVQISIPQGCSVNESSLSKLQHLGYIEKFEYNYSTINLYIRNFGANFNINLSVEYKANYPEQITGGMVRVYDYYNPSNEGFAKPVNITVNN